MFLFSNPQKAHPCVEPRHLTASFLETGYSTVVSSLMGSIGNYLSLCILTSIFKVSRCLLMEVVGDNWTTGAISHAKLQSYHHHQQTNIQFFYRPGAVSVAQPAVSKH